MDEQQTNDGLESILGQIKNPIERAEALYELASKGVQIPREIASEYVVYALFVPKRSHNPTGLNIRYAEIFAECTGLTEIAKLLGRKNQRDDRYERDQRYLDATR